MKINTRPDTDTFEQREMHVGYTSVVLNPDTFEPVLFAKVYIEMTPEEKALATTDRNALAQLLTSKLKMIK